MTEPLTQHEIASQPVPNGLVDRLAPIANAVLRGAARGICQEQGGFEVAELWLLDDRSQALTLAVRWEREKTPSSGSSITVTRLLASAPADVAALAGGAVVIEESADAIAWDVHHNSVGSAIGLPVSSDQTIHGVMWLLTGESMLISDESVELAEIVAARLALEVERIQATSPAPSMKVHDGMEPKPLQILPKSHAATKTPEEDQPEGIQSSGVSIAPIEAAAWTSMRSDGLASAGCFQLTGERMLALSLAAIESPESSAATLRSAVEWMMTEAPSTADLAEDAGILLTLLNRRIQESPLAGEGLACAAAIVDAPEDPDAGIGGVGTYAVAGPTIALNVRAAATDAHTGDLIPLGWTEPQAAYAARPFELAVRQRLVLIAGDPRLTSPLMERRLGDVYRAATADAHRQMSAEACLRRIATSGIEDALGAVALRRF